MDHERMGDRGMGDRGMGGIHHGYDEEEDQQNIYIGVPVPRGYRRKRRRRRSAGGREAADKERGDRHYDHHRHHDHDDRDRYRDLEEGLMDPHDLQVPQDINRTMSPAAERLRYILGEEDDMPTPTLFTEMDTLQQDGDELEWKESARWVKFEEKVEEGGERWSKPHVSTLSLHSLFELRTCIQTGTVLLDLEGYSLPQIVDEIIEQQVDEGMLSPDLREKISFVLLRKHRHQTKKPIHRSLADMGKASGGGARECPSALWSSMAVSSLRHIIVLPKCYICHAQSRSMNDISDTPSTDQLRNKFMKKIPRDAEASNVLVGEVDFLDKPFVAFVRLAQATTLGGLTEVPVPTRFLFILLGPTGKAKSYNQIGRAIATLMVDDVSVCQCFFLFMNTDDMADQIKCIYIALRTSADISKNLERNQAMRGGQSSSGCLGQPNGAAGGGGGLAEDEEMPVAHELGEELAHTGRFCGGLFLDIKRKIPWLLSDFYEGFHIQSISAVLFIYLGCITNAITFGGLLGDATDNYQGVMESFLGTALSGTVFCLFSGQPLIILSSTGPILIFEKLLFEFSKNNGIDYMELRLWIGIHSCLQCFLLVATDASYIIKYMTRFTEEGFSSLISFIFISDAIKKMMGSFKYYPINTDFKPDYVTAYKCECLAPDPMASMIFNGLVPVPTDNTSSLFGLNITGLDWSQLSKKECVKYGGSLVGNTCKYVPDLALMSFILFFGTYSMTVSLKKFKFSRYFPTKSTWANIPDELRLFVPALLVTILIFMDQQISAVIVNRKENKLRKGCGYHLDLFWVGVLMAACSFLGLPWYVAATVISIAHIDSLKMESESSAPGEQPQFLGVREQRLTGILVFVLTGVSIFLAPILQFIPMPVLYGVFLYMGVASLSGIQFWERIKLYMMPSKYQPDFPFLRHVPLRRVHLFTLVQIICLAVLWVLKSTVLAILFPVMILGLLVVRKMLDMVFSQHDLAWIDDILPGKDKKKEKKKKGDKDDTKKKDKKKGRSDDSEDEVRHVSITLHLKISCPSSPAVPMAHGRGMAFPVPQVKIEMESDYDTDTDHPRHRDMSSETTL
uniref:Anion exchange protein n=1 Tax=Oncorhynchus tshawytscha TaxID=74940 RepID=A0A8C8JWR6_ONCTS